MEPAQLPAALALQLLGRLPGVVRSAWDCLGLFRRQCQLPACCQSELSIHISLPPSARFGSAGAGGRGAAGAAAAGGYDSSDDEGAAAAEAAILSQEEALLVTNRLHQVGGWGQVCLLQAVGGQGSGLCLPPSQWPAHRQPPASRPAPICTTPGAAPLHAAPSQGGGGRGAAPEERAPAVGCGRG